MQRFILRENIRRFQQRLVDETDEPVRLMIQSLLAEARRKLAQADAVESGVERRPVFPLRARDWIARVQNIVNQFQRDFETSAHPYLVLDPSPGLHIVDINDAYGRATMTSRGGIAGERMFDVFPDNPGNPSADGVSNLYASLKAAAETGKPHVMALQRYDVRDATGHFVERYWRPLNTPLFDPAGRLVYLLHHVEDVTDEVLRTRDGALRR